MVLIINKHLIFKCNHILFLTGSEPGFTDTQEGRYPLPNLEIPGQINDPLLTEGPDTPSEPGLGTNCTLHVNTSNNSFIC